MIHRAAGMPRGIFEKRDPGCMVYWEKYIKLDKELFAAFYIQGLLHFVGV